MLYVNPLAMPDAATRTEAAVSRGANEHIALEELEHFFLFTLLREMRKTVPKDGLFDGGSESDIYNEMLDDALSASMAKSGQLGIAKSIEQQLRAAEAQHALKANVMNRAPARAVK